MKILDEIKRLVKELLSDSKGSHDWEHTWRVYKLCLQIGEKENADLEVLKIAALLHDLGRSYQDESCGQICHAQKGAELSKEILSKYNLDETKLNNIIHCIKTHRFRGNSVPQTKEAKILFDADKLDSIGAIGLGRAFLFAGEIGSKLHNKNIDINNTKSYSKEDTAYREFLIKLKNVKDKMLTQEGKRLAIQRHNFMVIFFERLNKEIEGDL